MKINRIRSNPSIRLFSFLDNLDLLSSITVRTLARISFILTIVLIPFRLRIVIASRPVPPVYADYTDFLLFAADIAMLLTIFFWLLTRIIQPKKIALGPWVVSLPLAGVTLMGFISAGSSVDAALSLYHALRLVLLLLFYLYIVNEVTSPFLITLPVAIQVAIQGSVGVAQILAQRSIGLQPFGEYELDPAWHGVSIISVNGERWLRAYGLSDHPNILGGCLALGLLWLLFASSRSSSWKILWLAGSFILGLEALFLTFSRTAWLAFGVGMVLGLAILWLTHNREEIFKVSATLITGVLVLAPVLIYYASAITIRLNLSPQARLNPQEIQSIGERQLLNRSANQLFVENATNGIGLGALPSALRARFPMFRVDYQPAHLVLLNVAAETGIFGATLYAMLLILPWVALWNKRRHLRITLELAAVSGLLLAVGILGLFDYYTWLLVPGRLWQWTVWGLWSQAFLQAETRGQAR